MILHPLNTYVSYCNYFKLPDFQLLQELFPFVNTSDEKELKVYCPFSSHFWPWTALTNFLHLLDHIQIGTIHFLSSFQRGTFLLNGTVLDHQCLFSSNSHKQQPQIWWLLFTLGLLLPQNSISLEMASTLKWQELIINTSPPKTC